MYPTIYSETKLFWLPSPHLIEVLLAVWEGNIYLVTKMKVEGENENKGQNESPTLLQGVSIFRASLIEVLKSSLLTWNAAARYCVEMIPGSQILRSKGCVAQATRLAAQPLSLECADIAALQERGPSPLKKFCNKLVKLPWLVLEVLTRAAAVVRGTQSCNK